MNCLVIFGVKHRRRNVLGVGVAVNEVFLCTWALHRSLATFVGAPKSECLFIWPERRSIRSLGSPSI